MTNAHSETGQMAVCCQNLTLGALSRRSALPMLVGALFKKFGLFLNTPRMSENCPDRLNFILRRKICLVFGDGINSEAVTDTAVCVETLQGFPSHPFPLTDTNQEQGILLLRCSAIYSKKLFEY
jgi:hypothetical protein